jgi:hypothetical protein
MKKGEFLIKPPTDVNPSGVIKYNTPSSRGSRVFPGSDEKSFVRRLAYSVLPDRAI